MASFRPPLESAFSSALAHLESLETLSAGSSVNGAALRARFAKPLENEPTDATQVIQDLVADVSGGLLNSAGGRFFGWVIGGSLPAALAADWLTSAWEQNAVIEACAPAASAAEAVVGEWLKDLLGLPETASFALTTGCQMAHVTCLAAARHALLKRQGWNVEENGLFGAPPIHLYASAERHGSIHRAVRLLGLGLNQIHVLPTDSQGRTLPDSLQMEPHSILLLQAGDLNIGAYDSFRDLIPAAHTRNAWVHIDGAVGLFVAASPRYRHLMEGAEQADSWTTDGHKWLNVPYDCGYAFVADSEAHKAALSYRASYMTSAIEGRDQMDWTPEWSRRARGFPTYAALRQLGRHGLADLIERCCRYAKDIVTRIGKLPGAEVAWEPTINQGLLRFGDDDAVTDAVIATIQASGEAFFTGSTWRGKRVMRVSVCNWQTNEADVNRAVAAAARALAPQESNPLAPRARP